MVEKSISLEEFKTHVNDREAHVLYLLRLGIGKKGIFKSMAAMARDMGVENGYIRQIKNRAKNKRSKKM